MCIFISTCYNIETNSAILFKLGKEILSSRFQEIAFLCFYYSDN